MNTVYFTTETEFDPRSFQIMGLSVKTTDNPIGYFGTGLKYAIAICLRHGQEISIHSKTAGDFHFTTDSSSFRGKEYTSILCNGQELPFTLDYGKDWELWEAYRELYCNTSDEQGYTSFANLGGETVIAVRGKKFHAIAQNHNDYFFSEQIEWETDSLQIAREPSKFLYYKGVRVFELNEPAVFTYNVINQPLALTENRTLATCYGYMQCVCTQIAQLPTAEPFNEVFTKGARAEHNVYNLPSSFTSMSTEVRVAAKNNIKNVNLPQDLRKLFEEKFGDYRDTVGARRPSSYEQEAITAASKIIYEVLGADINYSIKAARDLGPNILATCYKGEVFIAEDTFLEGQATLVAALYEEHCHKEYGYHDGDVQFQYHLVKILGKLAVKHHLKTR